MRARMTQIQENIRDSVIQKAGLFGLAKSNKSNLITNQMRQTKYSIGYIIVNRIQPETDHTLHYNHSLLTAL